MPSVDPTPDLAPAELRFSVPLEAQDASYFAASARISSFFSSSKRLPLARHRREQI